MNRVSQTLLPLSIVARVTQTLLPLSIVARVTQTLLPLSIVARVVFFGGGDKKTRNPMNSSIALLCYVTRATIEVALSG